MALALVFAFLGAMGFGIGTVFIRLATQRLSPPLVTFVSVGVGAVIAVTLALAVNLSEMRDLPLAAFGWFAVLAAMGYPVARLLNYTAISMLGAARVSPIGSVTPVFSVGLAMVVLGERPNLLVGLGTPVIVAGLVLVVTRGTPSGVSGQVVVTSKLGYLLAAAASLTFGGRDVINRHVVSGVAPPLVTAAFALLMGAGMLSTVGVRQIIHSFHRVPPKYMGICVIAGVFQGLAAISVLQALSRAPVTVVSPIYGATPLVVLVLAHLFLQRLEAINLFLILGTLLSVAGVVMVIVGAGT